MLNNLLKANKSLNLLLILVLALTKQMSSYVVASE